MVPDTGSKGGECARLTQWALIHELHVGVDVCPTSPATPDHGIYHQRSSFSPSCKAKRDLGLVVWGRGAVAGMEYRELKSDDHDTCTTEPSARLVTCRDTFTRLRLLSLPPSLPVVVLAAVLLVSPPRYSACSLSEFATIRYSELVCLLAHVAGVMSGSMLCTSLHYLVFPSCKLTPIYYILRNELILVTAANNT